MKTGLLGLFLFAITSSAFAAQYGDTRFTDLGNGYSQHEYYCPKCNGGRGGWLKFPGEAPVASQGTSRVSAQSRAAEPVQQRAFQAPAPRAAEALITGAAGEVVFPGGRGFVWVKAANGKIKVSNGRISREQASSSAAWHYADIDKEAANPAAIRLALGLSSAQHPGQQATNTPAAQFGGGSRFDAKADLQSLSSGASCGTDGSGCQTCRPPSSFAAK